MTVKYPNITVPMSGEDGNAFFILSRVKRALERGGVNDQEIEEFMTEATSGDYDHLLRTVISTVGVT